MSNPKTPKLKAIETAGRTADDAELEEFAQFAKRYRFKGKLTQQQRANAVVICGVVLLLLLGDVAGTKPAKKRATKKKAKTT